MPTDELAQSMNKIAKILAGLLLKDIEDGDQKQKIKRLKQCGFENTEIAKMLGTTPNSVAVTIHSLKNKPRSKTAAKAKKRRR